MKKLLTLLFGFALVFSLAMPVIAQDAGSQEAPKAEKKTKQKKEKKTKKEKKSDKMEEAPKQ